MLYFLLVLGHIIFATIWVGGHLLLCLGILPRAIKNKDISMVQNFESVYERIGIPSLIGQIITGFFLFYLHTNEWNVLLDWQNFYGRHFLLKVVILLFTIILAVHARFRIIPTLSEKNFMLLVGHIIAVTFLALLFIIVGLSMRFGIFY